MKRLEPYEGKLSRTVLRGGSGSNVASLPDFPTDADTTERVLSMLEPGGTGTLRILDPCAGEGVALAECKQHLGAARTETFGIEFDQERAWHAKTLLDRVIHGDFQETFITFRSFGLLWLNPPYGDLVSDQAATGDSKKGRARLEKLFYQRAVKLLQPGGVMVLIVPHYTLDREFAGWIAGHFRCETGSEAKASESSSPRKPEEPGGFPTEETCKASRTGVESSASVARIPLLGPRPSSGDGRGAVGNDRAGAESERAMNGPARLRSESGARCEQVAAFMAPEQRFKQAVVVGIRRRTPPVEDARAIRARLDQLCRGEATEVLPEVWAGEPYRVPAVADQTPFKFQAMHVDPAQLREEIRRYPTLWPRFDLHLGRAGQVHRRPVRKLSQWHLALSLAAGQVSGVVRSNDRSKVFVIKGDTFKQKDVQVAYEQTSGGGQREIRTATDVFVPVIRALDFTPGSPTFGQAVVIQ